MDRSIHATPGPRLLRWALFGLVVLAFATGGSAQISGWDDTVVQLLSLPVLALALWHLGRQPMPLPMRLALAAAGMVILVPLLQLLVARQAPPASPVTGRWSHAGLASEQG